MYLHDPQDLGAAVWGQHVEGAGLGAGGAVAGDQRRGDVHVQEPRVLVAVDFDGGVVVVLRMSGGRCDV